MSHNSHKGIAHLYDDIFLRYDIINSLITLGLDKYWRRKAAIFLKQKISKKAKILDICCGTGTFSIEILNICGKEHKIFGTDANEKMLSIARSRNKEISFILASADNLPFENETFDAVTISFATRNIAINRELLSKSLFEIRRVLKKNGIFLNLETTVPENIFIRFFMFIYVKIAIGILNFIKPESKKAYSFLMNSILNFHTASKFSEILKTSGFKNVEYKTLFPGSVCVHIGFKNE